MKRVLFGTLLFFFAVSNTFAAQQPVPTTLTGASTSPADLRLKVKGEFEKVNANTVELNSLKADKAGITAGNKITLTGAGTVADPFIIGASMQFLVQAAAPIDTTILWIDSTDESNPIPKVYIGAAWVPLTSTGDSVFSINDATDVDTTGKAEGKILKFDASGNLVVGDDSTGSGSVPNGTVNGQLLLWSTDQWVASSVPTWNQNTTGTAAGLTSQYIDWNSASGGSSIANKPTIDAVPTNGSNNAVASDGVFDAIDALPTLTIDSVPTDASTNPVSSNGVFDALALKVNTSAIREYIGWHIKDSDVVTAVADGKQAAVVPANMNGMNLVDLTCSVSDLNSAASGNTTVVLRRVRGATAVDMTSTGVTIAYTDYTASDETIDTANDDVATGDKIFVDVNAITTAAQKGLGCTAVFQAP